MMTRPTPGLSLIRRGTLAAGLCVFFTAAAAPEGRIQSITLSSGGMAEIHRQTPVAADGVVRIQVPLEQVDDILKSVVVRDPAGQIVGMNLDGLAPVDETFGRLPFSAADLASVAKLAAAMQGVSVRAASRGRTVEGIILGVAPLNEGKADEAAVQVLSVMTPTGQIQALTLAADATLDILDQAMRDKLQAAAQVSGRGRTENVRELAIALTGAEQRDVAVSYVVSAPVWKTAFRLLLAPTGARLQAWAVLENATGEDWRDIDLTLSSGAPVMLSQALHQRYWHQRPQVPVAAVTAQPPQPDRTAQRKSAEATQMAMRPAAAVGRAAMAERAPAPAPVARPAEAAVSQEGQISATYRLPHPVNLPAGQTLAVPYIDAPLPAESVSLFQPARGSVHPIAAVILENTTAASLPPGILTVYDEHGGHVGDAQLLGIPVGETRIASFAEDRKVEVTADASPVDRITQVSIADGVLHAVRLSRLTTTYNVKGASDAPRTVIVEHPRRSGWRFASEALTGETPTHYRLRIHLEPGATGTVNAVAERQESERIILADTNTDTLLFWSGNAADPETAQRLKTLAERRRTLARSEQRENTLEGDLKRAVGNQARIRENLSAVQPDSTLGQRYTEMLAKEEDRIAALTEQLNAAQAETAKLKSDLSVDF